MIYLYQKDENEMNLLNLSKENISCMRIQLKVCSSSFPQSFDARPWRDIDVMHNSFACEEAAWKIRRKRHDDGGRRSDRSLMNGFPLSVYRLLMSIRKLAISSSTAEFVSQKSWERASNTNDCCQMWVSLRRHTNVSRITACVTKGNTYIKMM